MNQEPSSWVSAPNVRKEDTEKKKRQDSADQTTLYFSVVRGVLNSQQAEM
jgi:hypothetical protein